MSFRQGRREGRTGKRVDVSVGEGELGREGWGPKVTGQVM